MRYYLHFFIVIVVAAIANADAEQSRSTSSASSSTSRPTTSSSNKRSSSKRSRLPPVGSISSTSASTTSTTEQDFQNVQSRRQKTSRRREPPSRQKNKGTGKSFAIDYPAEEARPTDRILDNDEGQFSSPFNFYDEADADYSDGEGGFEDKVRPRNSRDDSDDSDGEEYGKGSEKGALYDAYNLLHTLAQDFRKPFDAPAVVVVGHQSSGKSALIEALMGFQFNQVGGGTKTRRPIALRMQYNPRCSEPNCFLQGDDGTERPKSLAEIQEYINDENTRLERDPVRSFDSREINVRMEYKYCPNMILIDTPGLIAAPRVPKGRNGAGAPNMQQRALQKSAREAERLVVEKMRCQDYIILCVEDTMDWKHGATREVVQKADPDLSRTVIVNTKLDTKVPQFGTPKDLVEFLQAGIIEKISPHKLGGPFFTTVPSGRVGRPLGLLSDEEFDEYEYDFDNDDDFVNACMENEESDRSVVWEKLKKLKRLRSATANEDSDILPANALVPRIGISRLRGFLERRVDDCYRRNVAKIVPLLQAEHATAAKRLEACDKELEALSVERLKAGADVFCDEFCTALKDAIQGSVIAPSSVYGENAEQERLASGSFAEIQGSPLAVSDRTWDRLVENEVGNSNHRLYGGAQYHRTMREFNLAAKCLRLPAITEDEIANAAGVGDVHDGVNFLRAACVIALEKAQTSFDPLLESLKIRMCHVLGKVSSISEYILIQKKDRSIQHYSYFENTRYGNNGQNKDNASDITQNPQFRQLVRTIYEKFVLKCSDSTMMRCRDDLYAQTKFVAWDLHERGSGAIRRSLPDHTDMVAVYQVAVQATKNIQSKEKDKDKSDRSSEKGTQSTTENASSSALTVIPDKDQNDERDYYNLLQVIEEAAMSRDANRTNLVVGGLVQHIIAQWRETFARSVTTKFNCYFMLPFVDEFHMFLRQELQRVYEGEGENLCEVFDLSAARRILQQRHDELINECMANKRLQEKFDLVSKMMRMEQESTSSRSKL